LPFGNGGIDPLSCRQDHERRHMAWCGQARLASGVSMDPKDGRECPHDAAASGLSAAPYLDQPGGSPANDGGCGSQTRPLFSTPAAIAAGRRWSSTSMFATPGEEDREREFAVVDKDCGIADADQHTGPIAADAQGDASRQSSFATA
jgi:hypothetical protein